MGIRAGRPGRRVRSGRTHLSAALRRDEVLLVGEVSRVGVHHQTVDHLAVALLRLGLTEPRDVIGTGH